MKRPILYAMALAILGVTVGVAAQDEERSLPYPLSLFWRLAVPETEQASSMSSSELLSGAALESTCSGLDETFDTLTVCNDVVLVEPYAGIHFESADPELTAINQVGGLYYEGRTEWFGGPDALYLAGPEIGGTEAAYFIAGVCARYHAEGDTGRLAMGSSASEGCTLEAYDPTVQDGPTAYAHQAVDESAETALIELGITRTLAGEGEGEGEEVFDGFRITREPNTAEVKAESAAGSSVTVTAGGLMVFKLGNTD